MSRPHHYVFGHIALRQIFFHNPPAFVTALAERGEELLKQIWDDVGERIEENEADAVRLPSEGLALTTRKIEPRTLAVVVSLPCPEEATEAYFVGLILSPAQKELWELLSAEERVARYVTLELGVNSLSGETRTVLCEWAGESHRNLGEGPEATVDAFVGKLSEMVGT